MPEDTQLEAGASMATLLVIFIAGLGIGGATTLIISASMGNDHVDMSDKDQDGVPDTHDLDAERNAMLRITPALLEHPELDEDITISLNIAYDGNGDPTDDHDGQTCSFTFTIIANTSKTMPSQGCTVDTSDWSILDSGFGYTMTHVEQTQFEGNITHHWDLFPGTGEDTSGYNSSVDTWLLHQGQTVVLDGLNDGDDNEWNARLTLVFAAAVEE